MNAYYSHFFYSGTCRSTPAGNKNGVYPPLFNIFLHFNYIPSLSQAWKAKTGVLFFKSSALKEQRTKNKEQRQKYHCSKVPLGGFRGHG